MRECILYKRCNGKKVRCLACAHKCLISDGHVGICCVRQNNKGKLYLLVYGKFAAMHIDPIEKKPFNHFFPGTKAFSIGTVGCNLGCAWCQNHDISQVSKSGFIFGENVSPSEIVSRAVENQCKSIAYTYNEPIIFAEFIKDCATIAHAHGLKNILVTNGYFSLESFNFLKSDIDAMNIDLKTFSEKTSIKYCKCKLKPVLDAIKRAHLAGIHIEITTLVVPGVNDSEKELENIAKFIASVDENIPWHISRFFPMYKSIDKNITPIETLNKAFNIGKKYLKNVYLGNV